MRRTHSFSLAAVGSVDRIRRDTLDLPKGKAMSALRVKVGFPVANTSGGSVTMAAGDKKALLSAIVCTFEYGVAKRQPFKNVDLRVVRILQRFLMGSEIEGWSDTSTGLAKSLPNSATTTVYAYVCLPFMCWLLGPQFKHFFALGRSQSRTVECEFARQTNASFSTSGLALSGSITIDVLPQLVSVKGDRWATPPEYRTTDITDFRYTFPEDGLPLAIWDRTAVHAATSYTKLNVNIDNEEIHRDVSPTDLITEHNDVPNHPAEALITDEYTIMYSVLPASEFSSLPSGRAYVEQPAKDLATMQLGLVQVPVVSEDERSKELENVANNIRRKGVVAVNLHVLEDKYVASHNHAFVPSVIADEDDAELHKYPGLGVSYRGKAEVYVPPQVVAAAKAKAGGSSDKLKADLAKQLAAAVPGAASTARGYGQGRIFSAIQNLVR